MAPSSEIFIDDILKKSLIFKEKRLDLIGREVQMINYEEELKKFKPCLEVGEVEEAIHNQELTDVIDIVKEMMEKNNTSDKK